MLSQSSKGSASASSTRRLPYSRAFASPIERVADDRVEANAGHVQKRPAAEKPDVHRRRVAAQRDLERPRGIRRQAEPVREIGAGGEKGRQKVRYRDPARA